MSSHHTHVPAHRDPAPHLQATVVREARVSWSPLLHEMERASFVPEWISG